MAIFIWFFVVTEKDYENLIDVPISVVNVPDGKIILNRLPHRARVRVKGSGKDLIALGVGGGAGIDLDLSGAGMAKTFLLGPKDVFLSRTSGNTQPIEVVMPDSILVLLDDFYSRRMPINPNISVSVAPGFATVNDMMLSPDSVLVSGPRTLVNGLSQIETVPKSFSDLKFDLDETCALVPPESDYLELAKKETQIFWDVQQLIELSVSGVPVQVRNVPRHLSVYVVPSTVSLVLVGGGDLLARIDRKDIVAYIDYQRAKDAPGSAHSAVIEPPEGVFHRDANPTTFKLVFERK